MWSVENNCCEVVREDVSDRECDNLVYVDLSYYMLVDGVLCIRGEVNINNSIDDGLSCGGRKF